ncbi:MAG TPA: SDR family NAD(P)-dependent oxidoreductase [Polyangiaceae bacterium]|nr:SDR family NAD(P)-dependent oxidoreductase [Polyangiaceae bacterium]
MAVLVTGAAGFIGSHTTARLLKRGDDVVGLDNFDPYYSPERKRRNVDEAAREAVRPGQFELIEGDIRDRELLARLFQTRAIDRVVHLAAMAGVRASMDDPFLYYDVNLTGTLSLLEAVRQRAAQTGEPAANLVLASTSSAYGRTEVTPFVETDAADRPLAPYAASKRAAEQLGFTYHHLHRLDFTALRFFTVYGPRGRPDMMAYKVLDSAYGGKEVPYYGGGEMYRDWTYVDDIVSGVVAAADRRLGYEIINLGRGEPVRLSDFVATLERLAGKKPRLVSMPMIDADVSATCADIGKARRLLDYAPQVSVQAGVQRFFDWYVANALPAGPTDAA